MLSLVREILCRLLGNHVSQRDRAKHHTFIPDRRFFGNMPASGVARGVPRSAALQQGTQPTVSKEAGVTGAKPTWQAETVELPYRRRKKTTAPASGGARTGKRSKVAERQARYRNKDRDGDRSPPRAHGRASVWDQPGCAGNGDRSPDTCRRKLGLTTTSRRALRPPARPRIVGR